MNTNLLALARVHGDYWAIKPEYGEGAVAYLRDADYEAHLASFHARVSAPTPRQGPVDPNDRPYAVTRGVALISIDGVMTRKPTSYGGCSTLLTQHAVRLAGRDQDVTSILLVLSSPGGSVNGLQELTDEIAAVAAFKDVLGYIPDGAFSAAYYVATACTKLTIERTAQCGSLGTMTVLRDSSEQAKNDGVIVEVISTNDEIKGQGTPGTPISDAYRREQRNHVLAYGQLFQDAIALGRKLTAAQVKAVFTGACFMAPDALSLGLVDALGTLDDALAEAIEADAVETIDDEDEPLDRSGANPFVLSAEQQAGLATGVPALPGPGKRAADRSDPSVVLAGPTTSLTREPITKASIYAAIQAASQPVSAPGGQARPAGISQAPNAGAEKQTGTPSMSFRQNLINALAVRGFGKMVVALNGTTSEDPEVLARIVTDQVEAQASDLVASHELITVAKAHGVTDLQSFNAFHDRAKNGDRYLEDMRAEAKVDAIRAFGPESGPIVGASVDGQSLAQAIASRDAWRRMADERVGIAPDGSAPGSKTVPTATVKVAVDVDQPSARAFDRLEPAMQKKVKAQAPGDEKRQDALAATFLRGMGVEA